MFASSSSQSLDKTPRYVCVCSKYNNGQPHEVSSATWYRHLQEASTDEEKQRIRSVNALGGITLSTPADLPIPGSSVHAAGVPDSDTFIPRGAHRAATLRALAQRARESEDSKRRVGRRKRAKIAATDQYASDQEMGPPGDLDIDMDSTHEDVCIFFSNCTHHASDLLLYINRTMTRLISRTPKVLF
jgi:hypothetical protein